MDLLDEALQIMIPSGICKRISADASANVALDNCDSKVALGMKPSAVPPRIDYPKDISAELDSQEKVYRELGARSDERYEARGSHAEVELALKGPHRKDKTNHAKADDERKVATGSMPVKTATPLAVTQNESQHIAAQYTQESRTGRKTNKEKRMKSPSSKATPKNSLLSDSKVRTPRRPNADKTQKSPMSDIRQAAQEKPALDGNQPT